ncbi:hypothetical protein PHYBOEH_008022 [Phytophthora boehmeriae]|uniref:Mitochondrial import inner membrane translocase subunit TIM22 n=1 Tax=Phytophthora boehmeriae TaxID=109152 RepID=A0A8T1W8K7_9STRA|nr:hypothetical protein PHYBOEH_008022 [Phytophthora boehmeriae]
MGDSQNWSSFDDEPEVPKPIAATKKTETLQHKEDDAKSSGLSALTQPVALRNLRNRLIFGSLVGFVTGATFGGIDGAKLYMKTHGKLAPAALSSVARGAGATGGAFSGFFFAYQGIKTALVTQRGEDDLTNAGIATVAAGLPFIRSKVMKQNLPYALMLVVLDHFHEEINEYRT